MLTVVFATKNGARLLPDVLSSYTQLTCPSGGWRLVVVNNASSDETQQVLESFLTKLPLTILREDRPGKNVALNTSLGIVEGDLVVLTDDDAFPHRDWLVELRRSADEHPEASLFGGRILPRWESPPPDWVSRFVPKGPVFSLTEEREHVEGPVIPDLIFGPNMAVRTDIFRKGFRFDESIGPNGAYYAMGSESEFTNRAADAGYGTWYCERAVVEHYIRTRQLDLRSILKRSIRFGRGRYRLKDRFSYPPSRTWFGIPPYFYRLAIYDAASVFREMLWGSEEGRFRARWKFNFRIGQILEARHLRKSAVHGVDGIHGIELDNGSNRPLS